MSILYVTLIFVWLVVGTHSWTAVYNTKNGNGFSHRNLTILSDAIVHPLVTTSSKVQIAQNRQGQNQLIGGACLRRSCNQIITGRRLRYGRALAIIRQQDYLDVVDLDLVRRARRSRNRRSVSDVFLGFSEAKPKQSNQCKKKNNQTNQPKHRQKRQDSIDALSYTTTEDIEIVIQCRKRDGSGLTTNPLDFFQKTWAEYKSGFGDIGSDYWLGLETMYNLTATTDWSLRVSLQDWDGKEYVAWYNSFVVGSEDTNYQLSLSGYNSTTSTLPDALTLGDHYKAAFTTELQDHDTLDLKNCAEEYSGGWWHGGCGLANLNGINSNTQLNPVQGTITPYNGIIWYNAFTTTSDRGASLEVDGGSWATYKATEMRIYTNIDTDHDVSVVETATTVAAAAAIVAAAAAAQGGNLASMSGMTPGQVPSGLPQPGAVGGGSVFGGGNVATGSAQAIAAALVPAGLTPVAFFPPLLTQRLPATSVIFLEAIVKKRKKRYTNASGSDRIYGQFWEVFKYYKRNLRRFTAMVREGEFEKLFRPGKFSTEPPNNLELILRLTDKHFGGIVNSTKNTVDGIPKNIHTITKELFRMAVCLKPRLIQSGIERIQNIGNSEDMIPELGMAGIRSPRFLRLSIEKIMNQVQTGKNLIWQTYTQQFWMNWKINYEFVYKAYFMKIANLLKSSTESRTMEDVMNMMEENSEGRMEFPRDVMLEDCFSSSQEPLYGFVTNVTIPEDMLEPCLVGVECFENGTTIRDAINNQEINDNTDLTNSNVLPETFIKRQGIVQDATPRQTSEEFSRDGPPSCRRRIVARNRCRAINNRRIFEQVFPKARNEIAAFKRQGGTVIDDPLIFDQHMAILANVKPVFWLISFGVVYVGFKYGDELTEYANLIIGLVSNIIQSITATISTLTSPILEVASPITDIILGPSASSQQKLKVYPIFGPITTCFFSKTHAPFTITMNEYERIYASEKVYSEVSTPEVVLQGINSGRTFDNGMLNSIAQAVSGIASSGLSGLNTFATNALQCLDNGPRILYEPLDFEYLNNIPTTTEAAVVRTILGACYLQNTQLAGYVGNGNDAVAFTSESAAYTKCTQEPTCGGITYEPASKFWTLRTAVVGTTSTSGEISALKLCLQSDVAAGVGSIVVSSLSNALALNSPTATSITFINVNSQTNDLEITVNAGEKISIKCAALGNSYQYSTWSWSWSWENTRGYTELVDCTVSVCALSATETPPNGYELESFQTATGTVLGRANITSIAYDQSGTYTCKAMESDGSITATRTISVTVLCQATSDCPSSPPNLMCLTNNECNRCRRNSGTHEGCTASGTTPICDIDEEVANVQTTGTRKLALCVPCKKSDESTQGDGQTIGTCSQLPSSNLCCQSTGSCSGTTYFTGITTVSCTA